MSDSHTIEHEVFVLLAVCLMTDEMINHDGMIYNDWQSGTFVQFESACRERYFYIVLVDFLSCVDKGSFTVPNRPHLSLLDEMSKNSFFGETRDLADSIDQFRQWLDETKDVEIYLSSIDRMFPLRAKNIELLKFYGDACRHSISRSSGILGKAKQMLNQSGVDCGDDASVFLMEELRMQIHEKLLVDYTQKVTKDLLDIRWGIHEHLRREYERAYVSEEWPSYSFNSPDGIESPLAEEAYHALMNLVRNKPSVERINL